MLKQYKKPSRLSWLVACLFRLRSLGARKTYNLISPALMKTSPAIGFQQAKRRRRNKKEISDQNREFINQEIAFANVRPPHGSMEVWSMGAWWMVVWLYSACCATRVEARLH